MDLAKFAGEWTETTPQDAWWWVSISGRGFTPNNQGAQIQTSSDITLLDTYVSEQIDDNGNSTRPEWTGRSQKNWPEWKEAALNVQDWARQRHGYEFGIRVKRSKFHLFFRLIESQDSDNSSSSSSSSSNNNSNNSSSSSSSSSSSESQAMNDRIERMEEHIKQQTDRQLLINDIDKHVANQNFDPDDPEGRLVVGDTFFGGASMECFELVYDDDEVQSKLQSYLNCSPLHTIKHRQYFCHSDFVSDLLGFFDTYLAKQDLNPKYIEYGRAYEVRRFAVDELIRSKIAQKASSQEEESYSPEVRLFPMKPMGLEDVKECFSIPVRPRGMMMHSAHVVEAERVDDKTRQVIVKTLYGEFFPEVFPE